MPDSNFIKILREPIKNVKREFFLPFLSTMIYVTKMQWPIENIELLEVGFSLIPNNLQYE
jgi:hypothetical protein